MKVLQFMQEINEIVYNFHVKNGKKWEVKLDFAFNSKVTAWICVWSRESEGKDGDVEYFCDEDYSIKSHAGASAAAKWLKQFK